jgi:hypothetical protein
VPRLELLNYGSLPTVRASLPHVVNDRFEAVIRIPPTPGLGRSATVAAGKASLSSPCLRRPANWKLPTKGADHGDQHCNHHSPAVEQGKASRPKDATQTQGDMGPSNYGTHTLRRSKATLIYRRTKNLRAVQLLLGHTKLESTVRYLGIEVDDALEMAEQTEA